MNENYPHKLSAKSKIYNPKFKIPNVMVDGKAKIISAQPRLNQINNY
ncbi:hypothetical protein RintRC_5900 [Richelia intracellularis]|nr:hypothetical protein RintRC_5900 [Richelia intracellularis]